MLNCAVKILEDRKDVKTRYATSKKVGDHSKAKFRVTFNNMNVTHHIAYKVYTGVASADSGRDSGT